ncbi:MAG: 50S ribosomal protein L22 [Candidatus Komeilibacteria bacterium]|nr:50S ribosomal protein L22 [Candidatus Komeilibacteria bacterium]
MKLKNKTNEPTVKEAGQAKAKPGILAAENTAKIKPGKAVVSECRASARFLKVSPRKVKLVIDELKGRGVMEALNLLQHLNKGSVPLVVKLLNSAIANAENNFKLKKEDLYIKHIVANQGPVLKRFRPAAFGTAHGIIKRTTHLDLVLAVRSDAGVDLKSAHKKKGIFQKKVGADFKSARDKNILTSKD